MSFSIESIAQLDHSRGFAQLHQKFHQFNPFKVLRVDQFEIRHSNVLAWLLDPSETHQLGSFFVKKLISRLVTQVENEEKVDRMDVLRCLYASFSDTEVYREVRTKTNRFIDLLVVVPSQKLVLLIENKFHAGESIGQLEDYLLYAKSVYEDYTIIPIFLTLRRDAPSHPDYWILDYKDVLEIILFYIELNRESIADNIYDFLIYYTEILQEELVQDDEATQLALDVYQNNQAAIDNLFLSQHHECRKQPRYRKVFDQLDELSDLQQEGMKRIYERKQQTIDYIFKIGSNVLREAFLTFVQLEKLTNEVYKAHVQVPSFLLPEWLDYTETIGEPEQGYWFGHGLVIWFERTWDERLKVNLEVGPIPFETRLKLLNGLEAQGVSIRQTSKLEGKKYTKIYTQTLTIEDWANKQEIVKGMEDLYHHLDLRTIFKRIALAVQMMERNEEQEIEQIYREPRPSLGKFPSEPFLKFALSHQFDSDQYRIHTRNASFLLPVFRDLEQVYGKTREKWWWHDSTFTAWFDRLRDDRLKLTIELGPLQPDKRLAIIQNLENMGLAFSNQSKHPTARYTRLFSKSVVIEDWENEDTVYTEMKRLYQDSKSQEILKLLERLVTDK